MKSEFCIILITCANHQEAQVISSALLEKHLAACIQASQIESSYWWQGTIEMAKETRLMIKTRLDLFDEIAVTINKLSSYENPEIIALPIIQAATEYLDWVDATIKA
ncbi:MAG TPA: divalent-cation tolerance protein CutA [Oceanospirillales bacterium]|nr:divalent-cation tolerance protein CutA [Oceanospirillales bacterium]